MMALLVRFFIQIDGYKNESMMVIFTTIAIASMFVGNFLALRQSNVKRILAYSSIAHLGYVLVAFLAGGQLGVEAVSFYLVAYFITTVGAFGILSMLSDVDRDAEFVDDYKGLFWSRPFTATIFSAMLLSLAGIPLTAGFVGKFYILAAGVNSNHWLLVIVLAINSAIGLYYYIKIVAVMFEPAEIKHTSALHPLLYRISIISLAILAFLLIGIGVYPDGMMVLIKDLVPLGI
jgi:NADH-quinone oxidoreductase subunit N